MFTRSMHKKFSIHSTYYQFLLSDWLAAMQSEWIIVTHHAHFLFFYDFGVTTQSYIHSQLSFLPEIWI